MYFLSLLSRRFLFPEPSIANLLEHIFSLSFLFLKTLCQQTDFIYNYYYATCLEAEAVNSTLLRKKWQV